MQANGRNGIAEYVASAAKIARRQDMPSYRRYMSAESLRPSARYGTTPQRSTCWKAIFMCGTTAVVPAQANVNGETKPPIFRRWRQIQVLRRQTQRSYRAITPSPTGNGKRLFSTNRSAYTKQRRHQRAKVIYAKRACPPTQTDRMRAQRHGR
jgi:hypothetical protein